MEVKIKESYLIFGFSLFFCVALCFCIKDLKDPIILSFLGLGFLCSVAVCFVSAYEILSKKFNFKIKIED